MPELNRREMTALLAGVGTTLAASSRFSSAARAEASSGFVGRRKSPSIIILLADDLGYGDLGCYGHPSIRTPALDRMATEGQRWTSFYAGASVCSPSRGALMTRELPIRSGLYGVKNIVFWPDAAGGIPHTKPTIAEALKAAGYTTAMVGKWHLGDRPDAFPTRHGFDHWFGTPYSNDMNWLAEPDLQRLMKQGYGTLDARDRQELSKLSSAEQAQMFRPDRRSSMWNVPLLRSAHKNSKYQDRTIEQPVVQETLTRRYTAEATNFIAAQAKSEKPFFLFLAYNMPHRPTFVDTKFKGQSLNGPYGDAVEEIDWSVSQVRRVLAETDQASETLIFFSSDNGPEGDGRGGSAGLLRGHKGTVFEGGLRVPAIFCWPNRIRPESVHDLGCLMDLYATSLAIAGLEGGKPADSIDLSNVFRRGEGSRKGLLYYSVVGELLGYRENQWKVMWADEAGFKRGDRIALYNVDEDPSERFNLAGEHSQLAADLAQKAQAINEKVEKRPPLFDEHF